MRPLKRRRMRGSVRMEFSHLASRFEKPDLSKTWTSMAWLIFLRCQIIVFRSTFAVRR